MSKEELEANKDVSRQPEPSEGQNYIRDSSMDIDLKSILGKDPTLSQNKIILLDDKELESNL